MLDAQRSLELADEAYARFDVDAVVAHLSAAIRGFTAADDPRAASMACLRLGDVMVNALGNLTAARAWFNRAVRLVAPLDPCVEQGWAAVAAMGCDVGDPEELLACAELALDRARRFGDLDLETKALADAGLAHVQAGRIDEGFALLDEAMALACGPADATIGAKSACSFFTACYYTSSYDRANSWSALLRQHGLIGPEPGPPAFLSNHCTSLEGALLVELGRWGEADAVLVEAGQRFRDTMGGPPFHTEIVLADLRILQGRLAEAEVLLAGLAQAFEAQLPAARLHLARGDHELARAAADRGLRALGSDVNRAAELLEVRVHAELGAGDRHAAEASLVELCRVTAGAVDRPVVAARRAIAEAAVRAAHDDAPGAVAALQLGLERADAGQAPWRRFLLHVALARAHDHTGDRRAALAEAGAARQLLAGLDIVVEPSATQLLARLGGAVAPEGPGAGAPDTATLARSGTTWTATHGGLGVQLRDSKGMRYLAELVSAPGTERHALDLVDRIEGLHEGGIDRRRLGDAGPALDGQARAAYRVRLEELRSEIDDAVANGRFEAAEALQDEHDQLVRQLAQAFGLGGRERRVGAAAERARLNVTRSLRTAIARLSEVHPEAGAALDRHVRTGLYCCYQPEAAEIGWIVQSGVNDKPPG